MGNREGGSRTLWQNETMDKAPILTIIISTSMAVCRFLNIYAPFNPQNIASLFLFHFSHSSTDHLMQNLFSLIIFGWFMEREGRVKYLVVLFASSYAGAFSAYLLKGISGAGMSAGIFGIMGYLMLKGDKYSIGAIPVPLLSLAYSAYNMFQSLYLSSGVSYLAHAMGFVAGMMLAFPPEEWKKDITALAIILNAIAAIKEVVS